MERTSSESPAAQRHEGAGAADLERFLLYGESEIRQLLRSIAEHGDLVSLYFGGSNDFLLTTVLAVGAESVILDYGSREEVNQRALTSSRLTFATSRDKIKVQWSVSRIWPVNYDGTPAFCTALPASVLRLQRREFFRLAAPVATPLVCRMPAAAAGARKFEFSVADISIGGVALCGPLQEAGFQIGRTYKDCEFTLPDVGELVATIAVSNIYELSMRNGATTTRSGCRFTDLRGKMLMRLQRYINRLERERYERMARFA